MYNPFLSPAGKRFSIKFLTIIAVISFSFQGTLALAQHEGEQLFKICSACHTIGKGKLIGPDLKGVTERHDLEWLTGFIQNSQAMVQAGDEYAVRIFKEFNSIPMPPNNFTDDQIKVLLSYIEGYDATAIEAETAEAQSDEIAHTAEGEYVFMAETEHPFKNFRISVIISLALIFLALLDLFITRIIKAKFIHVIIILISGAIITEIVVLEAINSGRAINYEPDQPVLFSHKIHAGDNQIDCQYCHFTVEESRHAGIPPVQLCMNCHKLIKEGTYTGKEEIAKIYKAIETNKPIEWVKVYFLPDHVFFSHQQHVAVGKIACEQCHGDVSSMDRIRQVEDLSMGWCIECHRNTEVQFVDNDFYSRYLKLHDELTSGKISRVTVDDIGGNDCMKCHY